GNERDAQESAKMDPRSATAFVMASAERELWYRAAGARSGDRRRRVRRFHLPLARPAARGRTGAQDERVFANLRWRRRDHGRGGGAAGAALRRHERPQWRRGAASARRVGGGPQPAAP